MNVELKDFSIALRFVIVGIIIFAIAYPLMVGIAGQIWRDSAKGTPVQYNGETIGSKLIGQDFEDPRYFHGRPSSIDYDASKSGSRNLGPTNPELTERVERILNKISENYENLRVPSDLLTESGSALDPHITVSSAMLQVPHVSQNTGISENMLEYLIRKHTEEPLLGIFGMKRVNVLLLNIEVMELMEEDNFGR